jgi:hypothetical protein
MAAAAVKDLGKAIQACLDEQEMRISLKTRCRFLLLWTGHRPGVRTRGLF